MNESRYQELRETGWRRKLTATEEAELRAWLATHPELKADWEAEAGLSGALRSLPESPVSSNFTARVLQAVEREIAARQRRRKSSWRWLWHPLLTKTAVAVTAFCLGLFMYQELAGARRTQLVQSVATLSEVASLPGPEILQDFEVIRQLNSTPPPDNELLALLQ
jgi:anti-sigma factor RsiW